MRKRARAAVRNDGIKLVVAVREARRFGADVPSVWLRGDGQVKIGGKFYLPVQAGGMLSIPI